MRTTIFIMAVLEALFGFLLMLLVPVSLLFVESPEMEQLPNLKIFTVVFYGGISAWFLVTAIRFLQKATVQRALAVCRLGSILFCLFLTLIPAVAGTFLPNGGIAQKVLLVAFAFLICGAIAMHKLVLKPATLRAFL